MSKNIFVYVEAAEGKLAYGKAYCKLALLLPV